MWCLQKIVKDIQLWQADVDMTNELANKLLVLYANDDTSKIIQITDNMNLSWGSINKGWVCNWELIFWNELCVNRIKYYLNMQCTVCFLWFNGKVELIDESNATSPYCTTVPSRIISTLIYIYINIRPFFTLI